LAAEPGDRRRRGRPGRPGGRHLPGGAEVEHRPRSGDVHPGVLAEHGRLVMDGSLDLVERLRATCGAQHVLTDHNQLRTYESDGLLQYRELPAVAVLPASGAEVAAVVRAGNVAENSGGAHCFKYGFTTNYVCGLEVVLADGSVVQLGGKELDRPGYDLHGVFVGSEGTLGIATAITVRVVPAPESVRTLVAFFATPGRAGRAVSGIVAAGVVPGAIEMMDRLTIDASEQMAHAGWPQDAGAALLVELDGPERECDARFDEVRALCDQAGATGVVVARDAAQRDVFWKMRKAAFP